MEKKDIRFLINHKKILSASVPNTDDEEGRFIDRRFDILFEGGIKKSFYCENKKEVQLYMRELSKYMMGDLNEDE